MTEVPFHATRMGATYYEHTAPEIARQLKRLNDNLERLVELAEQDPRIPRKDTPHDSDSEEEAHP